MEKDMQLKLSMVMEYSSMVRQDVPVYLCNEPSSFAEVVCRQLEDRENCYMADFVRDDEDRLLRLNFDRIPCSDRCASCGT